MNQEQFVAKIQQYSKLDEAKIARLQPLADSFGLTLVLDTNRAATCAELWPRIGFQSSFKLYHFIIESKLIGVSRSFVIEWCRENETLSITKPPVFAVTQPSRPTYCYAVAQADLAFMPTKPLGFIGWVALVDAYSGWVNCLPIKDKTAATVTKTFERMFNAGHVPEVLRIDAGTEFLASTMTLFTEWKIQVKITVSNSHSEGLVERWQRTCKTLLQRAHEENGKSWYENLPKVVFGYNMSQNARGLSPYTVLFRRDGLAAQLAGPVKTPEMLGDVSTEAFPGYDHATPEMVQASIDKDTAVSATIDAGVKRNADAMLVRSVAKLPPIPTGSHVRILLTALDAKLRRKMKSVYFKRSLGVYWTKQIYKVLEEKESTKVPGLRVYKLEGTTGLISRANLLVVDDGDDAEDA